MSDKTTILHITDDAGYSLQLSKDKSEYVINNMSSREFAKLMHRTVCAVQEIWDDAQDTDAADLNAHVENAILGHFKLGDRYTRVNEQRAPVMLVIDQSIVEKIECKNILFPTVDSFEGLLADLDKDQFGAVCYSVYHPDKGSNGYYSMKYEEFKTIQIKFIFDYFSYSYAQMNNPTFGIDLVQQQRKKVTNAK